MHGVVLIRFWRQGNENSELRPWNLKPFQSQSKEYGHIKWHQADDRNSGDRRMEEILSVTPCSKHNFQTMQASFLQHKTCIFDKPLCKRMSLRPRWRLVVDPFHLSLGCEKRIWKICFQELSTIVWIRASQAKRWSTWKLLSSRRGY